MYLEELLQLIQDLPCDKHFKVRVKGYPCDSEWEEDFTRDSVWVDKVNETLVFDMAWN